MTPEEINRDVIFVDAAKMTNEAEKVKPAEVEVERPISALLDEMISLDLAFLVPNCKACNTPLKLHPWENNRTVLCVCTCDNSHCRLAHTPQGHILRHLGYSKGRFDKV